MKQELAIIGSGPAALMAADRLSQRGCAVTIFEKRKSPGRKLLVAGSSGLNVSNALPLPEFVAHYTRDESNRHQKEFWERVVGAFPPAAWIAFIEELGFKTFKGTSGRYFIQEMKASRFLQAWVARLSEHGVQWVFDHECVGFESRVESGGVELALRRGDGEVVRELFGAVGFALGGGSWESQEVPLRWPAIFRERGIAFEEFTPSNVGYSVAWPAAFVEEADGLPLKRILLTTARGSREGDAMITQYGIEGTPVYFTGTPGVASLDLRPDLSVEQIAAKLTAVRENLSPLRRITKTLQLCPAALALLFHCSPREWHADRDWKAWARRIRAFPLTLGEPRPLAEAISSRGGVSLHELNEDLELRRHPGVFLAGEMLNWDAPTGGFLLQACVAQGAWMGEGMAKSAAAASSAAS